LRKGFHLRPFKKKCVKTRFGCEGFNFKNEERFLIVFKTSLFDSNKKGAIPCFKENNNNKIKEF